MRIAFLCKRHYTGKDVLLDRYGRLYELPHQLARLGHAVGAWCLDYRGCQDEIQQHEGGAGALLWRSLGIRGVRVARIPMFPYQLYRELSKFKPDVVIGASDIPHVKLATWLGRKLKIPCAIDLYDNFESFGQARIPGFRSMLAHAIKSAHLIITVSHSLREKICADHAPIQPVLVMPNGINNSVFSPGSRGQSRQELGLPIDSQLIGTAGGLSRMKGLHTVYAAWQQMAQRYPNLHLVLAGPVDKSLPLPVGPRVHYLGELHERQVVKMFRALDVGIIPLADSPFGRYCFPQKAYEMLASHLPVVVADTGEMASLFSSWPQTLFAPNDSFELQAALLRQLEHPCIPAISIPNWPTLITQLETELKRLVHSN